MNTNAAFHVLRNTWDPFGRSFRDFLNAMGLGVAGRTEPAQRTVVLVDSSVRAAVTDAVVCSATSNIERARNPIHADASTAIGMVKGTIDQAASFDTAPLAQTGGQLGDLVDHVATGADLGSGPSSKTAAQLGSERLDEILISNGIVMEGSFDFGTLCGPIAGETLLSAWIPSWVSKMAWIRYMSKLNRVTPDVPTPGSGLSLAQKIQRIEEHLARLDALDDPANAAMLERLRKGCDTPVDRRFIDHELREADLMDSGLDARDAHLQTLEEQGIPYEPAYEAELYHPDVIDQYPEHFNPAAAGNTES